MSVRIMAHVEQIVMLPLLFQKSITVIKITSHLTLGKTKVGYYITHWLEQYFHNELPNSISQLNFLVSTMEKKLLNSVVQKRQMDFCLHFWDYKTSKVASSYYSSIFHDQGTMLDFHETITAI